MVYTNELKSLLSVSITYVLKCKLYIKYSKYFSLLIFVAPYKMKTNLVLKKGIILT